MLGLKKSGMEVSAVEKPKRTWSTRRKLLIALGALIVIIALAVGLGVGLTRGDGGDDDDGDDDQNEIPPSGPNRTAIWKPEAGISWQIVLQKPIDLSSSDDDLSPDVEVYDIDAVDNSYETISLLQKMGKKVICYFSAGTYEDWRHDKDDFDEEDIGNPLDEWEGERWLNVSSPRVHDIMKKRIHDAWAVGCDAIDPDNVDGYQNDNGLDLTSQHAVDYMRFLADEAKSYKMAIGLKNAGDIIPSVIDFIDFSVNEQCIEYSECETFAPFIEANKPVFNIEYPSGVPKISSSVRKEICSQKGKAEGTKGFSTVIKKLILDGWVEYCDGETYETEILSS